MEGTAKPWIDASFAGEVCDASGHKAKAMEAWCQVNDAIFWPVAISSLLSLDFLPFDHSVCGFIESKVCAVSHGSIDDTAFVEAEWTAMPETYSAFQQIDYSTFQNPVSVNFKLLHTL